MNAPWPAPLVALTLFTVATALLPTGLLTPAAWAHLVLAVAVLPLILAAMGQFTPVLTRSAPPPRGLWLVPPLALAAGLLVIGFLQFGALLLIPAALLALAVVIVQFIWMWRRARAALGTPHPGLDWYLAALGCLAAALIAAALAAVWPEPWTPLRRLHLHLNLLGFVGLTALGTLWVLLPTVAGYGEPTAAERLRRDLPVALGGTLLSAVGAAFWWPLGMLGAAAWLYVLGRFLTPPLGPRRSEAWAAGPARALLLAVVGLLLNVAAGLLHAVGIGPAASPALFVLAFLLPLVSGAAAHLVPQWSWPGPATPRREAALRRLAHGHGTRGVLFIACGIAVAAGVSEAAWLAALALAQFILQALWALVSKEP